jgi:hypothetical protein
MMAVPLCNVLNVDHESDIGANNLRRLEWSCSRNDNFADTTRILLTTSEAVNTAVWLKNDGMTASMWGITRKLRRQGQGSISDGFDSTRSF